MHAKKTTVKKGEFIDVGQIMKGLVKEAYNINATQESVQLYLFQNGPPYVWIIIELELILTQKSVTFQNYGEPATGVPPNQPAAAWIQEVPVFTELGILVSIQ